MTSDDRSRFDQQIRHFNEWAGVVADLTTAIHALRHPHLAPADGDPVLRRVVWEGALVSYMRAFTSSNTRQIKTRELLETLTPEQKREHEKARHWRNKHAAHYESTGLQFGVIRIHESKERFGLSVDMSISASPDDEAWAGLAGVAEAVEQTIRKTKLEVLRQELEQTYPLVADSLELVDGDGNPVDRE